MYREGHILSEGLLFWWGILERWASLSSALMCLRLTHGPHTGAVVHFDSETLFWALPHSQCGFTSEGKKCPLRKIQRLLNKLSTLPHPKCISLRIWFCLEEKRTETNTGCAYTMNGLVEGRWILRRMRMVLSVGGLPDSGQQTLPPGICVHRLRKRGRVSQ